MLRLFLAILLFSGVLFSGITLASDNTATAYPTPTIGYSLEPETEPKVIRHPVELAVGFFGGSSDVILPEGSFFSRYGEEPTHPGGISGGVNAGIRVHFGSLVFGGSVAATGIGDNDFRGSQSDRRRWHAPGEGEAYVYARPVASSAAKMLYIGWKLPKKMQPRIEGVLEVGVQKTLHGMSIEQGYDRFNSCDPYRRLECEVESTSLLVTFVSNTKPGVLISLGYNLANKFDFGEFGTAKGGHALNLALGMVY